MLIQKYSSCLVKYSKKTLNDKFIPYYIIKSFSDEHKINLTHTGENKMVNIGKKQETFRYAKASCFIKVDPKVIDHIRNNTSTKGDVLRLTEIAGIMAAKKTSDLIPLCHQINLNTVNIKVKLEGTSDIEKNDINKIYIESYVESLSKTGVEMEAMVSVSVAALTLYDMCKSVDKTIEISEIKLIEKFGGKSGHFKLSNSNSKV